MTPKESIVVAYSKAVPFVENHNRIVMGIGFVESVGELQEYNYSKTPIGDLETAYFWERSIGHSIRFDRRNGFLFPLQDIQAYLIEHPQQSPDDLVVLVPEEYRNEFSYATEHLSHDALIHTLNKTIVVLQKYKDIKLSYGNGANWDDCIDWCQKRIIEAWKDRGAYPGLGAVLGALGVPYGYDVALALREKYNNDMSWDKIVVGLKNLPEALPKKLKDFFIKPPGYNSLLEDISIEVEEQQNYLELLSRITLSLPQAQLLLDEKSSDSKLEKYVDNLTNIHKKSIRAEIVRNPYLLYEKTRMLEPQYRIDISKIDLAMLPPKYIAEGFFTSTGNQFCEPNDKNRLRAIIVSVLEREAVNGSSLMLAEEVIEAVRKYRSDVLEDELSIRMHTIQNKQRKSFYDESFIQFPIKVTSERDDEPEEIALQLVRLRDIGDKIRCFVNDQIKNFIDIDDDWNVLLETVLRKEHQSQTEQEQEARKEKIDAITKMAKSRISVLTGGAGTGKTTTLAALCFSKKIKSEGILVLAPTGKARVVISSKLFELDIKHDAKTLFEFLMQSNHCDTKTWSYYLSGKRETKTPATVIIDECSMLTEEMLGALAEALQGVKRVIFVGDPNQLPPIGTGKPFYELVRKLKEEEGQPRYANLLVSNRQKQNRDATRRLDTELSKLFTEDLVTNVGEDLFEQILKDSDNIEFVHCENTEALPNVIRDTLKKININNVNSFDKSLGGKLNGQLMEFNHACCLEDWQIISPYRNKEDIGTRSINALIQSLYRLPKPKEHKATINPLGTDGIRFAEKVINIQNQDRNFWKHAHVEARKGSSMGKCEKYIANGEIGIVFDVKNEKHSVEFSSQKGYDYRFNSGVSEGDSQLELAYALTVHKAQGSGFKVTIFVLIEPERGISPLVTREMLYTAVTRQSDKVFIIYNKQPWKLKKYGDPELSDLAHRKTNLFGGTILRQYGRGWYDNKNIFITTDGIRVKSKSEIIVYEQLRELGKNPVYEKELHLGHITVHPDFTLETPRGTVYWEHLGMLGDYSYRKYWERKQELYKEHGITEENGNLILSQDELTGAIDAKKIRSLIDNKL